VIMLPVHEDREVLTLTPGTALEPHITVLIDSQGPCGHDLITAIGVGWMKCGDLPGHEIGGSRPQTFFW
jgi:hypothetical protein